MKRKVVLRQQSPNRGTLAAGPELRVAHPRAPTAPRVVVTPGSRTRRPVVGRRVRNLNVLIPGTRPCEPPDSIEDWIASGFHPCRRQCVDPSTYKVAWCRFCDTPVEWSGRKPYCDADQDGEECCETRYKRAKRRERYERTLARVQVDKADLRELHRLRSVLLDSLQTFVDAAVAERGKRLPVTHFLFQRRREISNLIVDAQGLLDHIRRLPEPGRPPGSTDLLGTLSVRGRRDAASS